MESREIANKIYNELLPKYNITAYLISKDWYVSFIENVLNSNKLNYETMESREVIQQYSLEWYKEMRKLNKDTIISLVESNGKHRDTLKEQITKLQSELKAADSVNEKSTTMLGLIHDIVDKQNFNEDSDLHEIYKITHNSF